MDKKVYAIDGTPASASEIIRTAQEYDPEFRMSVVKTTSWAAHILKNNGYKIDYIRE